MTVLLLLCGCVRDVTPFPPRPALPTSFESLKEAFAPVTPSPSNVIFRFDESSHGLPQRGSWRNSLDVADFNGDGRPDLVTPPERGSIDASPHLFLQNRDGSWRHWDEASWPKGVNYGSAAAADFNRDGHADVVTGAHLQGVDVFLGDGKGNFMAVARGLEESFPTRRVIVTDVDRDTWPDLVALNEGPGAAQASVAPRPVSRLRIYRNAEWGSRWEPIELAGNLSLAGDWLASGDFDGDSIPDFISSNIYFGAQRVLFLSQPGLKWSARGSEVITPYGYVFAVGAARLIGRSRRDDAIVSYGRSWPASAAPPGLPPPAATQVVGIDRITWSETGPVAIPIERFASDRPIWGLATADFDGDRDIDIVYASIEPRTLVFLLNDGRGNFSRAEASGISLPDNPSYDVRAADIDRDGATDIVMMFERGGEPAHEGSIRVYLNRTGHRSTR